MFLRRKTPRGFVLLSMLMALAIVGILSGMYMGGGPGGAPGAKPWPVQRIDRAKSAVCAANRRTAMSRVVEAQINSGTTRLSVPEMQRVMGSIPACPGGGRYYTIGGDVFCTLHSDTPKFGELLGLY
ncbi:hypothetical protein KQI84_00380 [bacterium]|nr:hypothetical protein [bacterium]